MKSVKWSKIHIHMELQLVAFFQFSPFRLMHATMRTIKSNIHPLMGFFSNPHSFGNEEMPDILTAKWNLLSGSLQ